MSSARTGTTSRRVAASSRRSKSPDATSAAEQPGLRRIVQQRVLNDVFQAASDKHAGWKVLIVDDHAMKVISSAVGMYDIMERKVTLVESLDKKRAPFPDMGAIYLLDPNADSIQKLLNDFNGNLLYGNAIFLYFIRRLPDTLLDRIKTCKPLLKRLKALSEINVDFLAKEERAFTLDMGAEKTFTSLYLRKSHTPIEVAVAEKLVTLCATLNEYPHIRYRQSSAIATSLANVFHLKMDDFVTQNPKWWYHGGPRSTGKERGTLLLLDRADDCLTPLMHDFTYQCMVHDLLPMDGDRITYQAETTDDPTHTEAKDVLLDEKDALWVELRGQHIAAVIETLSARIREIMNSSTGSALGTNKKDKGGNMSLSQMASALKALPEYREVMSKLSQHMHLSHECMDAFRKQNLLELSDLEQTLATGKDDDGRSPKLDAMMDNVEKHLIRTKDPVQRLRLILIVTIAQGGLRQQDRRRLMNAAELSRADIRTMNSLEIMGLSIFAASEKNKLMSLFGSNRLGSGASSDDEAEYAASRYVPSLKETLEELVANRLSLEEYPSVLPLPENMTPTASSSSGNRFSVRSARSSTASNSTTSSSVRRSGEAASARRTAGPSNKWSKSSSAASEKRSTGPKNFSGGRCLVFMMGGLAYSELRTCRQVMEKEGREVIVGSTDLINATDFINDLAKLGKDDDA